MCIFLMLTITGCFLIESEEIPGGAKYKLNIIFEVKGETKPVCVAETLSLVYFGSEEKP